MFTANLPLLFLVPANLDGNALVLLPRVTLVTYERKVNEGAAAPTLTDANDEHGRALATAGAWCIDDVTTGAGSSRTFKVSFHGAAVGTPLYEAFLNQSVVSLRLQMGILTPSPPGAAGLLCEVLKLKVGVLPVEP